VTASRDPFASLALHWGHSQLGQVETSGAVGGSGPAEALEEVVVTGKKSPEPSIDWETIGWILIAFDVLNTPLSPTPDVGVYGAAMIASAKAAKSGSKAFSKEKQALVDMAKADRRKGMASGDMQAYKDLNKGLPDPFPTNKVRGPEAHPTGAPHSQQPHGHVGPVDHIPIRGP
jgi:hypothetical protein